jgi:hypothetical protein
MGCVYLYADCIFYDGTSCQRAVRITLDVLYIRNLSKRHTENLDDSSYLKHSQQSYSSLAGYNPKSGS